MLTIYLTKAISLLFDGPAVILQCLRLFQHSSGLPLYLNLLNDHLMADEAAVTPSRTILVNHSPIARGIMQDHFLVPGGEDSQGRATGACRLFSYPISFDTFLPCGTGDAINGEFDH